MGMKAITAGMLAVAALAAVACNDSSTAPASPSYSASGLPEASVAAAQARGARSGFGFNGTASGFPTGAVFLTGGGSFDTAQLLASTTFKCTGADAGKRIATGAGTVVLLADFYRAGDGIDESFTAQMIVSDTDIAPDIPGDQTLWVQGVGCGHALVHFNR